MNYFKELQKLITNECNKKRTFSFREGIKETDMKKFKTVSLNNLREDNELVKATHPAVLDYFIKDYDTGLWGQDEGDLELLELMVKQSLKLKGTQHE